MRPWIVLGVAVAALSVSAAAAGQRSGRGAPAQYNVATETTLAGTVAAVTHTPAPRRGSGGLHLTLAAAAGVVEVHVGPAAFAASKSFTFEVGDEITVRGSKVTVEGREVVLARELTKGDRVLVLRDEKGFPLWSGRVRS